MKFLKSIQYQDKTGMKSLKKYRYQDQGCSKKIEKKYPMPGPGWYENSN